MEISTLALNPFLSDIKLEQVLKDSQKEFIAHKFILATQSSVFKQIFEEHQQVEKIVLPKPIISTRKLDFLKVQNELAVNEDHLSHILKLVYLQIENPTLVREEAIKLMNKNNCFSYYSICLALGFEKIKIHFEEFIVSHINKDDDSMNLLFDSIQFESEEMKQSALDIIVPKFSDFLRNQYLFNELINLPFEAFKSLIQRDDICVNEESDIFIVVYQYILKRENDPDPPQSDENPPQNKQQEVKVDEKKPDEAPKQEGDVKTDQKPQLPEEAVEGEKKQEIVQENEKKEEEKEKKEEQNEKKEEEKKEEQTEKKEEQPVTADQPVVQEKKENTEQTQQPNNDQAQVPVQQAVSDQKIYVMPDNLEEKAKQKLQKFKLTSEQKKELLLSLRLGYVSHENLLKYSQIEQLQEFKDIFLLAISSKLNFYDSQEFLNRYQFNLDPRLSYADRVNNLSMLALNNNNNSKINTITNFQKKNVNTQQNSNILLNDSLKSEHTQHNKASRLSPNKNQGQYQDSSRNNSNPQPLVDAKYQGQNNQINQFYDPSGMNIPSLNNFVQNLNAYQQYQNQQIPINQSLYQSNIQTGQIRPPQQNMGSPNGFDQFQNKSGLGNSNLRQPNPQSSKQNNRNIEFVYKYDMDDNGALYYLGTQSKTKPYVNPHVLGQVQAFASTVRAGKIEFFVGRDVQNLSSCNEKMSFMGVDLGEDRYLYPTAYTLRNRNSTTYVMLNWVLEASADGQHFMPIDKRINYDPNDSHFNYTTEKQREQLKERGATSSYAIEESSLKRILQDNQIRAFRFFRVVQISKNSNGSDNLSLSGFELYGLSFGNGWN